VEVEEVGDRLVELFSRGTSYSRDVGLMLGFPVACDGLEVGGLVGAEVGELVWIWVVFKEDVVGVTVFVNVRFDEGEEVGASLWCGECVETGAIVGWLVTGDLVTE